MVDKVQKKTVLEINKLVDMDLPIFSFFSTREYISYFVDLYEKTLSKDKSIVYICCSWWSDSMFLTYLLVWYRHIVKWLPLSITKILHINHWSSLSDDKLEAVVMENFGDIFSIEVLYINKEKQTETILRKKRWKFYKDCLLKNNSLQDVYLCLWHNLDDRIENSFLHFDRGTHRQWIVNMQIVQKKYLFDKKKVHIYTCFRPLLSFPKKTIRWWCDTSSIPYVEDTHNHDLTQKRIQYRYAIQELSVKTKQNFYEERLYVYNLLEEKKINGEGYFKKLWYPVRRKIDGLYSVLAPSNQDELVELLVKIGLFVNMSTLRLGEMMKRFHKKQGSWYIKGWRFLFANWCLYIAKQPNKYVFREYTNNNSILIERLNFFYRIDGFEWYIQDQELVWATLTFPQKGDCVWSKAYMDWAARHRIPFFRRRSLPIIKKNNIIEEVLPHYSLLWNK